MALPICPECSGDLPENKAENCPHCGSSLGRLAVQANGTASKVPQEILDWRGINSTRRNSSLACTRFGKREGLN